MITPKKQKQQGFLEADKNHVKSRHHLLHLLLHLGQLLIEGLLLFHQLFLGSLTFWRDLELRPCLATIVERDLSAFEVLSIRQREASETPGPVSSLKLLGASQASRTQICLTEQPRQNVLLARLTFLLSDCHVGCQRNGTNTFGCIARFPIPHQPVPACACRTQGCQKQQTCNLAPAITQRRNTHLTFESLKAQRLGVSERGKNIASLWLFTKAPTSNCRFRI